MPLNRCKISPNEKCFLYSDFKGFVGKKTPKVSERLYRSPTSQKSTSSHISQPASKSSVSTSNPYNKRFDHFKLEKIIPIDKRSVFEQFCDGFIHGTNPTNLPSILDNGLHSRNVLNGRNDMSLKNIGVFFRFVRHNNQPVKCLMGKGSQGAGIFLSFDSASSLQLISATTHDTLNTDTINLDKINTDYVIDVAQQVKNQNIMNSEVAFANNVPPDSIVKVYLQREKVYVDKFCELCGMLQGKKLIHTASITVKNKETSHWECFEKN